MLLIQTISNSIFSIVLKSFQALHPNSLSYTAECQKRFQGSSIPLWNIFYRHWPQSNASILFQFTLAEDAFWNQSDILGLRTKIPCNFSLRTLNKGSMDIEYKSPKRLHPCLMPLHTGKVLVSVPFIFNILKTSV